MNDKEKLDEKFQPLNNIEKKLVLILSLTFLYQLFFIFISSESSKTEINRMLAFVSFVLLMLMVPIAILFGIFYISSFSIRLNYYKFLSENSLTTKKNRTLLYASQILFFGPFFFLILDYFSPRMVLLSLIFLRLDLSNQRSVYKEIDQIILDHKEQESWKKFY